MKLTEIAVDRPISTSMIVGIVVVTSLVALSRLPIDLMPDVTFPNITVVVTYPGATPEEIETLIMQPLEEAMGSVENVQEIDTASSEERANVRLKFSWGVNLDEAANDVRQRLDRMRAAFPDEVEPPVLYKFDVNQGSIMGFGIASDTMPLPDVRYLAEHKLAQRLERLVGVASVQVSGGRLREIQVNLSREKLDALLLTPQRIVQAIRAENINLPAGEVFSGETQLIMRTQGQMIAPSEFGDIVVATREGVPIYLRDVAEITDGLEELRRVQRIDGIPSVTMRIYRQSGGNTVTVADAAHAELEKIRAEYPDLSILTLYDTSKFIKDSIGNVQRAAIFGSLLAIIILFIFLRDVRTTLIIASSIPVSVMASFSLIYFSGFTLNIVSFGGLALGVGLLVDNSIVVLENIFRHRESGQDARSAAIDGTQEVSTAITASTLTTLVVFLPLFFLSGAASIMFTQLAYVVAFSLACSLIVSLTLVPTLARHLLHLESLERTAGESFVHMIYRVSEEMLKRMEWAYRRLLHFSLAHRLLVVTVSCSLFAASLPLYATLGFEYMPTADEGEVRVYGTMAPGTRLEVLDEAFTELERICRETLGDDVKHVMTDFGMSSWYKSGGSNGGRMELELVDASLRTRTSAEAADALRDRIGDIPGMRAKARPGGGLWIFRYLTLDGESVSVEIRGHDQTVAMGIAEEVKRRLEAIDGIKDPNMRDPEGRPEIGLRIDRFKAAEAGFTVTDVAEAIRTNFGGEVATRFRDGGEEYDVRVRLQEKDRQTVKDLRTHWLTTPSGERVPASNFIRESRISGPLEIRRKNQERVLRVNADLDPEYSLGNVMAEVESSLQSISLPDDFSLVYGGEYEEQKKSHRELIFGLVLAILLVYMVMAGQFESMIQPFVIMFSIPFATIGVLGMLWMTHTTISVQSILGIVVLVGIVVNNAIVLVDYINLLRRKQGLPLHEAVEEGGRRRLRPIIMTTLTTTLALVPMAIGLGSGGELQAPMARVVIGGLLTSTLITLLFVPVLYTTIEELLDRRREQTASGPAGDGDGASEPLSAG